MANESQWHVKREISIGHMITTLLLAGGLVGVYSDMDNGIKQNSQDIEHIRELHVIDRAHTDRTITNLQKRNKDALDKIDVKFNRIDGKLDKLLEKQHTHP